MAAQGKFIGTLTAHHGTKTDYRHPQPAIWTLSPIQEQSGPQKFPKLHSEHLAMTISGRHIDANAHLIVDGRRAPGSIRLQ